MRAIDETVLISVYSSDLGHLTANIRKTILTYRSLPIYS
jgi:hypothetical protein